MAKSAAKKKREKMQREGMRNPEKDRGLYASAEMYRRLAVKTAKTKKDLLYKRKPRSHSLDNGRDGFFFMRKKGAFTGTLLIH